MSARFMLVVLVASSVAIWALVLAANEQVPEGSFRLLGYGVGALSVALLGFERLAWRWPLVRWAVRRPDLRGTWQGTLVSDYERVKSRHEVFLVVHQTLETLRLSLLTRESQSHAMAASVVVEADGRVSVFYGYRNDPRLEHQGRSRPHRGAVQLWVGGDGRGLAGEYWTDRRTTGSLELRLVSRRRAGSWEEAVGLGEGGRGEPEPGGVGRREVVAVAAGLGVEQVPEGLVDLLANVVPEADKARMISTRAEFPASKLPDFKSALEFWHAVVGEATRGRIPLHRLVEEAARQFPHNEALREHARRLASGASTNGAERGGQGGGGER